MGLFYQPYLSLFCLADRLHRQRLAECFPNLVGGSQIVEHERVETHAASIEEGFAMFACLGVKLEKQASVVLVCYHDAVVLGRSI